MWGSLLRVTADGAVPHGPHAAALVIESRPNIEMLFTQTYGMFDVSLSHRYKSMCTSVSCTIGLLN